MSFMSWPSSSKHLSVSGWIEEAKPHFSAMAQSCLALSALGLFTKTWARCRSWAAAFSRWGGPWRPSCGCLLLLRRSRWLRFATLLWRCREGGVRAVRASECWEGDMRGPTIAATSGSISGSPAGPDPSPASRAWREILYRGVPAPFLCHGGVRRLKMPFRAIEAPAPGLFQISARTPAT